MNKTRAALAAAVRPFAPGGRLTVAHVRPLDALADALGLPREDAAPPPASGVAEPTWIAVARMLIGTRETPGPGNNPIVVGFWQRLGAAWLKTDADPWCGGFIAHCIDAAGLPYPKLYPRAAEWATYGVGIMGTPPVGAIGVKSRAGGNHVFFIVGETRDKRFYKALGGNQGDAVSIVDIAKSDTYAVRWPARVPVPSSPLPVLPKGTISGREA